MNKKVHKLQEKPQEKRQEKRLLRYILVKNAWKREYRLRSVYIKKINNYPYPYYKYINEYINKEKKPIINIDHRFIINELKVNHRNIKARRLV